MQFVLTLEGSSPCMLSSRTKIQEQIYLHVNKAKPWLEKNYTCYFNYLSLCIIHIVYKQIWKLTFVKLTGLTQVSDKAIFTYISVDDKWIIQGISERSS